MTVLYDLLTGAKVPGGTWTKISGAADPTAPAEYDDAVDFSSAEKGDHVYRYTVESTTVLGCTDTADVTVTVGEAYPYANDECVNSSYLHVPWPGLSETTTEVSINFLNNWIACEQGPSPFPQYCALQAATMSGEWTTAVDCDGWYYFNAPWYADDDYTITITINSSSYPVSGLTNFRFAVYSTPDSEDCDENTLIGQGISGIGDTATFTFVVDPLTLPVPQAFFIRVGAAEDEGGQFDINITATLF